MPVSATGPFYKPATPSVSQPDASNSASRGNSPAPRRGPPEENAGDDGQGNSPLIAHAYCHQTGRRHREDGATHEPTDDARPAVPPGASLPSGGPASVRCPWWTSQSHAGLLLSVTRLPKPIRAFTQKVKALIRGVKLRGLEPLTPTLPAPMWGVHDRPPKYESPGQRVSPSPADSAGRRRMDVNCAQNWAAGWSPWRWSTTPRFKALAVTDRDDRPFSRPSSPRPRRHRARPPSPGLHGRHPRR